MIENFLKLPGGWRSFANVGGKKNILFPGRDMFLGEVLAELPEPFFGVVGGGDRRYELTESDLSFLNLLGVCGDLLSVPFWVQRFVVDFTFSRVKK